MAGTIKGIIVEIGGDTSGLQKALSKVSSSTSSLSKELKGVNSLLKLDPENVELLTQKQTLLNESIEETQEKLEVLKKVKEQADKKMQEGTKISEENYRSLQREIINTENKYKNLSEELKKFNQANSNWTKAGKKAEEFGKKIDNVSKKIDKVGDNLTTKLTAPIIALGTVAVTTGASLEKSVDKYIATTGKSIEETEKYKEILTNINNSNFGDGFEDIANSMAIVEQQMRGINEASELENITKKAYYLKDAFDSEINESVRAAKMMMEQWGISADESFELINQGYQKGLDKNGDLLDSINEYSVHFRQIGLSATDMFNTFELGAESGAFSIDKVGDAIKEMGIRLKDGTATDVLKSMKLNAKELEKAFAEGGEKGSEAFSKIVKGLQNIKDPLKQNQAGVTIFGTMWEDLGKDAVFSMTSFSNSFDKTAHSLEKSMDTLYSNTENTAETTLKRIKTISSSLGTKLLPIANKLLDKADDFIDKLENLNEEEQQNIIKIGLMVTAIGPAIKIFGKLTSSVGTVSKGIGTFKNAVGVMKSGVDSGNGSVDKLAGCLKALTSPTGLATTSITLLAGSLVYLTLKQTEAQKQAELFAKGIYDQKQSFENYNKSIDETTNSNLAQINSVERLKDELETLVDENGKVKDGYKSRVSFILNELNIALEKEYGLNGDIIESYKELQSQIDSTIEKKKAEIKLSASEQKYKYAIENETQSVENLKQSHEKLGMSIEEAKIKSQELATEMKELEKSGKIYGDYFNIGKEKQALDDLIIAYQDAESIVKQCVDYKKQYETDYALFVEKKYSEIGKTVYSTTENWCDKSLLELGESIQEQGKTLKIYKQIYKDTGDEIALQNMQQAQKNIENLAEELKKRTNTIGELGEDEKGAWKELATTSYETYSLIISNMDKDMQIKIQETTGVIAAGTPQMQEKAEELGKKTVEEFEKSAEAKEKALNTIKGYLKGLKDEEKRELLKNAGIENVDIVLEELDKQKLSEENGKNILKGLWEGLKNNSWQGKILGVASGLAQAVNKAFTGKDGWDEHSPSKKMKKFVEYYIQPISDVMLNKQRNIINTAKSLASKVNSAFESEMKIPQLNDFNNIQAGLNKKISSSTQTVFTTPQIVFNVQELDEAKLQQCFNYINKKFGSQY